MTKDPFQTAFLAAQKAMRDPCKDSTNPHFRSKFVSLKGVLDAVRGPLHTAGITISQMIDFEDERMFVVTTLTHVEGGGISSRCPVLTAKPNDPQALGSAITYAKRYGLAGICGVAPSDDDDGESAVDRPPVKRKAKAVKKATPKVKLLRTFANKGEALKHLDTITTEDGFANFVESMKGSQEIANGDRTEVQGAYKERQAIVAEGNA